MRRIAQPPRVVLQAEDGGAGGGFVGAHAFEHRQAVMQGMGQDMSGGIAPRHEFAVVPDEAVTVSHRHGVRSEEHTSELQSLMRISYAVFCLKKKKQK